MLEIDHVASAVRDVDAACEGFVSAGDAELVWTTVSDEWQYRTAYLLAGPDMFTLIEPTSDESFMASFIENRGPGLHHLGVNVADLDSAVERMTNAGGEVIMEDSIPGVRDEATLHPRSWFGLQIQLIEWDDVVGPSARDHIEALREAKSDGHM